jgi:hypothetical protein
MALAFFIGVLLSGLVNAALVSLLPSRSGAPLIWITAVTIVAGTMAAFWVLLVKRRQ